MHQFGYQDHVPTPVIVAQLFAHNDLNLIILTIYNITLSVIYQNTKINSKTHNFDAVQAGYEIIVSDSVKSLCDESLEHLVNQEEKILWAVTLNLDHDLCPRCLGQESDVAVFMQQGSFFPYDGTVRVLIQSDLETE